MSKADEYKKLLRSPKWKRKRKVILKRDGGKCTVCGSPNNLVVHHTYYLNNYPDPWKYPNKSLLTLCESCHRDFHEHHETPVRACRGVREDKKQGWVYIAGKYVKKNPTRCKVLSLAEQQEQRGLKTKRRAM